MTFLISPLIFIIIGYILLFIPNIIGDFSLILFYIFSSIFLVIGKFKIYKNSLFIHIFIFTYIIISSLSIDFKILLYAQLPIIFILILLNKINKSIEISDIFKFYSILSFVIALFGLVQYFFIRDLFGFSGNYIYNSEMYNSTSFRITSFFGSAQNNAFLYSIALFTCKIRNIILRVIYYSVIITAGLLTLSTFFGISFFIKIILLSNVYFFILLIIFFYYLLNNDFLFNTYFESFSFSEIMFLKDRYSLEINNLFSSIKLFSNDLGMYTSGIIDREFDFSHYSGESAFLIQLLERGIIYSFFIVFSFFILIYKLNKNFNYFKLDLLFILFIIFLNYLATPNLTSPRILFVVSPLLLAPFISYEK